MAGAAGWYCLMKINKCFARVGFDIVMHSLGLGLVFLKGKEHIALYLAGQIANWSHKSHILLIVGSNSFSYAIISLASVNQGSLSIRCSLIQDASYQKVLVRNLICLMKQCIVKADTLLFHKLLYLLVMHFTKGAKSVRFHQR